MQKVFSLCSLASYFHYREVLFCFDVLFRNWFIFVLGLLLFFVFKVVLVLFSVKVWLFNKIIKHTSWCSIILVSETFEYVKFNTMAQKQIEEKLETVDQEISGIRTELHDLPTIKEDISSLAKRIEGLGVQAEKQQQQQQTLLNDQGKTTMEEVPEGSSSKIDSMVDVSESMMMEEKSDEKHTKLEGEDSAGDRSKFRKLKCKFCGK